jgi:phosphoesterase RecJ-like protein
MIDNLQKMAPSVLETIKKSKHILLHCHPYPDPDSIGSVLATSSVLKKMGKIVTPIIGDSRYPDNLTSLPNREWLVLKKYSEIDLSQFDLFIILDSSSPSQVTQLTDVVFPKNLKTVVIDHHRTNKGFGDMNLIDTESSSTSQILYDLFKIWGIKIDSDEAICLLLGIYADTGGFKYQNANYETLMVASELAKIYPNYHKFVFDLDNYRQPVELEMMGLALTSIEKYFNEKVVFSVIPYEDLKKRGISKESAMEGLIGNTLRSVMGWDLVASLVEAEPNVVTVSLRTRDESSFDVSKIAMAIGEKGGGHKGAAGTTLRLPMDAAKIALVDKIGEVFPVLNKSQSILE